MNRVAIAGVGMTPFGKFLERDLRWLSEQAVSAAITDSGIEPARIGAVYFGNAAAGVVTGQEMIRAEAALRGTALAGRPMFNVENACASGSSALHLAWLSIIAGQHDAVLVVGAEKLSHADKKVSFDAFARGVDLQEPRPPTSGSGSVFMDIYAAKTRKWMAGSGVTKEDFARVVVKSRRAGHWNPMAQFREETTIEEVLGSRMVADPLTLFMCSGIGDGAAAIVLCSEAMVRRLGVSRPVWIRASTVVTALPEQPDAPACAIRAAQAAYEQSGIGPDDIHVAELHDASAPAELIHYENLGFCKAGEAGVLLRSGATDLGGRLSVNASGGLLSRGHPVGATGAAQVVEITQQLRGQAGTRQRPDARVGMAENNGGQIGHDAAVAVVTLLST